MTAGRAPIICNSQLILSLSFQLPRFWPYIRFCSCMLNACRLLQDKVEKDADFKTFEKVGPSIFIDILIG